MPNRTTSDERDKLDHSSHPTTRATQDDLHAPGGAARQRMNHNQDSDLTPPSDDEDRIKDFFSRHGGASQSPRRSGRSQGGLRGWTEIEAGDGHLLRCDWSRSGTLEEMSYTELAPPPAVSRR